MNMSEYDLGAWRHKYDICMNMVECALINKTEYVLGPNYTKILNMAKFWIWQGYQYSSIRLFWTCQKKMPRECSEYILGSKYVRIQNLAAFLIFKITQGSKYPIIWLNMSEEVMNIPEYVWFFNNDRVFWMC